MLLHVCLHKNLAIDISFINFIDEVVWNLEISEPQGCDTVWLRSVAKCSISAVQIGFSRGRPQEGAHL